MTPGKPLLKNTNTPHISRIVHLIETTMLPLNRAQKVGINVFLRRLHSCYKFIFNFGKTCFLHFSKTLDHGSENRS